MGRRPMRDLVRRKHDVHGTRIDSAPRHAEIHRRSLVLCKRHAPSRLYRLEAVRTVRGGSGEYDAYRLIPEIRGQRIEEIVYRHGMVAILTSRQEAKGVMHHRHARVRRNNVHGIGSHLHSVGHFHDRHVGLA